MSDERRASVLAAYARHVNRFEQEASLRARRRGSAAGPPSVPDSPARLPGGGRNLCPSHRQLEVLALMADGHSNRAIAQKLGVSEETAKSHVRQLAERLGSRSRAQTVSLGYRYGFLSPEPLLSFPRRGGSAEMWLSS